MSATDEELVDFEDAMGAVAAVSGQAVVAQDRVSLVRQRNGRSSPLQRRPLKALFAPHLQALPQG